MHPSGPRPAIVVVFCVVWVAAGCAGIKQSIPPSAPASPPAVPATRVAPAPAGTSVGPVATAPAESAPTPPAASQPPAPSVPSPAAAKAAAPEVKPAAKATAAPAPPPKATPPAQTEKPRAPPLDLKALETQLKETKAIGVMTKLSLKNQVDDLLSQFRAFYQGKLKTTLAELRRPFDLLVLKLLSLLQDSDPPLAAAIVASREALWGILSDRAKFASLDGG
jgi:hypothetical protein